MAALLIESEGSQQLLQVSAAPAAPPAVVAPDYLLLLCTSCDWRPYSCYCTCGCCSDRQASLFGLKDKLDDLVKSTQVKLVDLVKSHNRFRLLSAQKMLISMICN
jgi:hypothetical protein